MKPKSFPSMLKGNVSGYWKKWFAKKKTDQMKSKLNSILIKSRDS